MQPGKRVIEGSVDDICNELNDLIEKGHLSEAEQGFSQILQRFPNDARSLYSLGFIAYKRRQYHQAKSQLLSSYQIDRNYAPTLRLLGIILLSEENDKEAKFYLDKAIALEPAHAYCLSNLGNIACIRRDYISALDYYQKAVLLEPNHLEILSNLANVYRDLGEFDKARKIYKQILLESVSFCEVHHYLSTITRYDKDSAHLVTMKALSQDGSLNRQQRMFLSFALGKAYDDLAEYDKAFRCFNTGNQLKRQSYQYQIENDVAHFNNLKKALDKNLLAQSKNIGFMAKRPIFIVGLPRTGSSLCESILSSHSEINSVGESLAFERVASHHFLKKGTNQLIDNLDAYLQKEAKRLGQLYVDELGEVIASNTHFIDKMPYNFRWIPFIKILLPQAKIIHCTRDYRDTRVSIFKSLFVNEGNCFCYSLKEMDHYYLMYQDLMNYYHMLLDNDIYELKYESLINEPQKEVENLLAYLGLAFEASCLNFQENKTPISTVSTYQVRQPLYHSSIGVWQRYEKYIAPFTENIEETNEDFNHKLNALLSQVEKGFYAKAREGFEQLLQLSPNHPRCLYALSYIDYKTKHYTEAKERLESYLEMDKHHLDSLKLLGAIAFDKEQYEEAMAVYQKALSMAPEDVQTIGNLAVIAFYRQDIDNAIQLFKKALELEPENIANLLAYANLLRSINQFEESRVQYQKIIELHPYHGEAHLYLSKLSNYDKESSHFSLMQEVISKNSIDEYNKMLIQYALAKVYEDSADYNNAFHYLELANQHRAGNKAKLTTQAKDFFDMLKQVFTKDFIDSVQGIQLDINQPLFIIGMPRSGTTLIEQMLSCHQHIESRGELMWLEAKGNELIKASAYGDVKEIQDRIKNNMTSLAQDYATWIAKDGEDCTFIIDKLPLNFRWLGLIKCLFPQAKFIHCQRDARDVALSNYKQYYAKVGNEFAYDLDLFVEYYGLYLDIMDYWYTMFADDIYPISYERLVDNAKAELTGCLHFLGFEFEPDCLSFHEKHTVVRTASNVQVRQPLYASSIGQWQHYERHALEVFTALGALMGESSP